MYVAVRHLTIHPCYDIGAANQAAHRGAERVLRHREPPGALEGCNN